MASARDPGSVPDTLIRKIGALPSTRIAEVEDFVDFLGQRENAGQADRALRQAARDASAASLARVWSNPEDDAYDAL